MQLMAVNRRNEDYDGNTIRPGEAEKWFSGHWQKDLKKYLIKNLN
jgi:hypothetical protein